MGKFYIINSPWGFSTIWSLIKGWLDEVTVAKIHILSSDYKKQLIEQIPAENLPVDLGGTCQCAGGCSMSDEGPWKDLETMAKVREAAEEKRKERGLPPSSNDTLAALQAETTSAGAATGDVAAEKET